jgi:hypothetical protein
MYPQPSYTDVDWCMCTTAITTVLCPWRLLLRRVAPVFHLAKLLTRRPHFGKNLGLLFIRPVGCAAQVCSDLTGFLGSLPQFLGGLAGRFTPTPQDLRLMTCLLACLSERLSSLPGFFCETAQLLLGLPDRFCNLPHVFRVDPCGLRLFAARLGLLTASFGLPTLGFGALLA